jgi:hypothetical protein
VAVAVEEHRRSGERGAALPSGHLDLSAKQIARPLEVRCVPQEVNIPADDRHRREFVSQAIFELPDPHRNRLSSDEDDMPPADYLLNSSDDALSLIQAQWG